MLLKLVFVSLAVASIAAQNCIPGAEPDGNGGCQCASGNSGNPQLCCYSTANQKGCFVAGDPILTSYTGNVVGLDFPCGTMIASSRVSPFSPIVNVFAAGREVASGAIFTSQVKIEVRLNSQKSTLTFNFDNSPFQIRYETNSNAPEDFTMGDGENKMIPNAMGDISITYDAALSLFMVSAAGIDVNVRPAKGNSAQQATPGLCVMEPQDSSAASAPISYACSLNTDVLNTPSYLDSAIQPMKNYMYNNGILKDTTDAENADSCQSYQTIIVDNCDAADRTNAMKKCAFIMFHSLIRRCFFGASSGTGRVMSAFLDCLDTYCQGTKSLCDSLQVDSRFTTCAPHLADCETWPPYRRVNSFVPGEGDGTNFGLGGGDNGNNQGSETTEFNPDSLGIFGPGGVDQENGGAGGVGGGFAPPF